MSLLFLITFKISFWSSIPSQEDKINEEVEEEEGNQTLIATPVSKLRSASRKTAPTTPVEAPPWKLGEEKGDR